MSGYSGYVASLFSGNNAPAPSQPPSGYLPAQGPPYSRNPLRPQATPLPPSSSAGRAASSHGTFYPGNPPHAGSGPAATLSSNPNYPTSAQPTSSASSTSSWTSSLSSRLASLRKGLTAFSAEEQDDPDSEDLSHVCTVLRAYYIEKSRPFPPWLPPDPKQPSPVPQQYSYLNPGNGNSYGGMSGYGSSQNVYGQGAGRGPGGGGGSSSSGGGGGGGGGGGLTDLFGNSTPSGPTTPQSLRMKTGSGAPGAQSRPVPQRLGTPGALSSAQLEPPQQYQQQQQEQQQPPQQRSRPLPSQRSGSYQQQQPADTGTPGGAGGAMGVGARDRLRARLQGGTGGGGGSGRNSPLPTASPADSTGGVGAGSYFDLPGSRGPSPSPRPGSAAGRGGGGGGGVGMGLPSGPRLRPGGGPR